MPGKDHLNVDTSAPGESAGTHGEQGSASRRRLLSALGVGAALSALGLVRAAGAQEGSDTTDATGDTSGATTGGTDAGSGSSGTDAPATTAAATTTTFPAPPERPTPGDQVLLNFAGGVELAAQSCYDNVLDRVRSGQITFEQETLTVMEVLRQHHLSYAQSIASILGKLAAIVPDPGALAAFGTAFSNGTADAIVRAANELEDTACATHLSVLPQLMGTDGAALLSSILIVEGQHSTALQVLSGDRPDLPPSGLEPLSGAISPTQAPE
jgi:hypothetical protein